MSHKLDKEYLQDLIRKNTVINESGCWIWSHCDGTDYGQIAIQNIRFQAHRVSAWAFGLLDDPAGRDPVVRHRMNVCTSKACVNPNHLEVGSYMDNFLDHVRYGENNPMAANYMKEMCVNGHLFDEENTYWYKKPDGRLRRQCKACKSEKGRLYYRRKGG